MKAVIGQAIEIQRKVGKQEVFLAYHLNGSLHVVSDQTEAAFKITFDYTASSYFLWTVEIWHDVFGDFMSLEFTRLKKEQTSFMESVHEIITEIIEQSQYDQKHYDNDDLEIA